MGCGRVRLKSIHHAGGGVEVITFAFVLDRCEVIQDANTRGGEAHIVPELLALLRADMLDSLALHKDIITDQEVHKMLVLDGLAMKKDGEVILTLEGYVRLMERDSQSFLIHILVEERPHVAMDNLTCADDVIGVSAKLLKKHTRRRFCSKTILASEQSFTHKPGTFLISSADSYSRHQSLRKLCRVHRLQSCGTPHP